MTRHGLQCLSALVGVKDSSGKPIFQGKEATGFSNTEEEQVGKVKVSLPGSCRHSPTDV